MITDKLLNETKFFIGPMSKNVVDSVVEFSNETNAKIGFIPSRRQVDYLGGYVNNWDTRNFYEYVRKNSLSIPICRDHGGENQGQVIDDGTKSFSVDCQYFDIIHVDPFRTSQDIKQAAEKTKIVIENLSVLNSNILYEVGTEEAIFKYQPKDLNFFLEYLKNNLSEKNFNQIKYAVVQSGTGLNLSTRTNTGTFNEDKLKKFIDVIKKYDLLTKEHNGDYLIDIQGIKSRFDLGLDAINIAPEFGQIESEYYLDECKKDKTLFNKLYKICYNSGKWKKWITDIDTIRKDQLIMTCCHYVLSDETFLKTIKSYFPNADKTIKENIKLKLNLLNEQTKSSCL